MLATSLAAVALSVPTLRPTLRPPIPAASPGTTALRSPAGFEEAYDALRDMRATTGRPLLHVSQLEAAQPALAARLAEAPARSILESYRRLAKNATMHAQLARDFGHRQLSRGCPETAPPALLMQGQRRPRLAAGVP